MPDGYSIHVLAKTTMYLMGRRAAMASVKHPLRAMSQLTGELVGAQYQLCQIPKLA